MLHLAEADDSETFEVETRLEWVKSRINLLRQLLKIDEPAEQAKIEKVEVEAEKSPFLPQQEPIKSPKLEIDQILPEKPKSDFLNIPSTLPKQKDTAQLRFADSIQADHDSLTEELIQTVRLIRRNNIQLRDIVKSDDGVIEEATSLLSGNTQAMERESKNLKNYSENAWMTTWRILSLIFFVFVIFLFGYLFIRLT